MADEITEASLKLGGGNWGVKEDSILGYNDENGNYKPIPFDFSRASIGTRVNRDGLIEVVQDNIPRIDFSSGEGSLLLEPQRTNSLLQSNQFDTTWFNTNSTETGGQSGYDGSNDAWLLSKSALGGKIRQNISVSGVKTFSLYTKANASNWVAITFNTAQSFAYFDLSSGALGSAGTEIIDYNIESVGGDWYRVSLSTAISQNAIDIYVADGDNDITGTSGSIYIQNAQLEEGSYPTSYIPTSGSAVTRVADSCQKTSASDYIGQTEGSVYVEVNISNTTTKTILVLDIGGASNFIILDTNSSLSPEIKVRQSSGSFPSIITGTAMNYGINKIAFCYKSGDYAMYVNGVLSGTSTSTTFPSGTISKISVGANPSYGYLSDAVYDIKLYKTRLTNAELAELTQV
jgi:hypothetical protein